ncbi:MAG: ABC transporter ATP-binding protein [Opitutales bacterium]
MSEESTGFALEAEGLTKSFSYGDDCIEVLCGADLRLSAGRSVSIRGESGCGKTTLLNLLARLDTADSGKLRWAGECHDPTSSPGARDATRRAHFLGVVYQAYYLVPELNALENVLLAGRLAGVLDGETKQRGRELLNRVGVGNRERQLPQKLSGGERQRVVIARALLNRPRVILADEPTGNLDEHTAGEVMELLLAACHEEDASLVLVTHNPAYAKATDDALFLSDGNLRPV